MPFNSRSVPGLSVADALDSILGNIDLGTAIKILSRELGDSEDERAERLQQAVQEYATVVWWPRRV